MTGARRALAACFDSESARFVLKEGMATRNPEGGWVLEEPRTIRSIPPLEAKHGALSEWSEEVAAFEAEWSRVLKIPALRSLR